MGIKNIIIFGKNGQVGSSLCQLFQSEPEFNISSYSSKEVDFSDLAALKTFLDNLKTKPEIIINSAAYTNVDKAEEEKDLADKVNHKAVAILAEFAAKNDIILIHYSTDYVFDGSGDQPFAENNKENLNPVNHYGKTKLDGENAIINSGCNYIILRTSWVWNSGSQFRNFANTIKKLAKEKEEIDVVCDQIGSPTNAGFIAQKTIKIIKKLTNSKDQSSQTFPFGIYHLTGGEDMSWYDFAIKIVEEMKKNGEEVKVKKIIPILSSEYKTPAKRPLNSRLSKEKSVIW